MRTFVPLVRRMKLLALVCTGVVIVSQLGASAAAFADEASYSATARQALIILKSTDINDMHKTIAALKDAGIHPMHVIPPRVVIADVPASVERSALAISNVASVHRSAVTAIAATKGADLASGTAAWNYLVSPELAASLKIPPKIKPLVGDAFEPPRPEVLQSLGEAEAQGAAPGYDGTSEFMIGSVTVGVILPESNEMSVNTEDWSNIDPVYPTEPNRKQIVLDEIVAGMNWWATKGGSEANLTFYYDPQFGVPTQYEPITMNGQSDENVWVADILQNMGYTSGDHITRLRAYINNLRTTYNTDWSFAFIVADSLNDEDGSFGNSQYYAWAYYGGPHTIMPYGYNMRWVASHETGHIFRAADEYCYQGGFCCYFNNFGYLDVYNGNCEYENPSSVDCMMKNLTDAVCTYTNGQLGWRDTDSDGKPDPIDNVVADTLNPQMTPTTETVLTFTGTATDVPCESPSHTRPDITINKITAVRYRIDNGNWSDACAVDGFFDEDVEDYNFTVGPLEVGQHRIDTQAYSTSGNTSTVIGQDVEIALETGSLRVTIYPRGAVNTGAQWRRAGMPTWLDSGYTEDDVAAGSHTVEFKDVPGWLRPANLPVSVSENQLTDANAVYTAVVTIGTGTGTSGFPLATGKHDARSQTIYRASEIGSALTITALALDVNTVPGQTMSNFTIRMKHTDLSAYGSSPIWESSDWITVYQTNETITTTGWVQFDFTTPFEYNGSQNLMVDISFNNSSFSTEGKCRYSTPGGMRTIYYLTDSGYGDPLGWSGRTPTPLAGTPIWNVRLFVMYENMDLNNDGIVNFSDFAIFAFYWMDDTCSEPDWCEGTDFDESGEVDILDLAKFVKYWLEDTIL
jgi:hypothetical protein